MGTRAAGVIVALALAVAAPAQGASVSVFVPYCAPEQAKYGQCYPDEARYAADPGEANRLTITFTVDQPSTTPRVTYRDDGAPLRAGSGCTRVDDHTASCTGYQLVAVANTGDGDDVVTGDGTIDAGPGNDSITGDGVLIGGSGDDTLQGGDRNDTLLGGPGADTLQGGAGNDTLRPDDGTADGQDVVDGGAGIDVVSYEQRKDNVTVSLQQPLADEDRLTGIESVRGGAGSDTLTGDAGANVLDGGPGNDRLTGGAGADVLDGRSGADVLDAGGGNDQLYSGAGASHDVLACGDGLDAIRQVGRNSLADPSCERLALSAFELLAAPVALHLDARRAGAPLLTLRRLTCAERPCTAGVRAIATSGRTEGFPLAAREFALVHGAKPPRLLPVPLERRAATLVRRRAVRTARITIVLHDGDERARVTFLAAFAPVAIEIPHAPAQ